MGFLIAIFARLGASQRLARVLGVIVPLALVGAAMAFLWARGDHYLHQRDHAQQQVAAQQAQIEAFELDAKLKEQASLERSADTAKTASQAQELNDARTHPGDDAATRRLRTLCSKLRQQDPSRFNTTSACRRFTGEGGTAHS